MITIYDFINLLENSHEHNFALTVEDEDDLFITEMTAEGACVLFGNKPLVNFLIEDGHIILIIPRE